MTDPQLTPCPSERRGETAARDPGDEASHQIQGVTCQDAARGTRWLAGGAKADGMTSSHTGSSPKTQIRVIYYLKTQLVSYASVVADYI